jgi:hypothetical protein
MSEGHVLAGGGCCALVLSPQRGLCVAVVGADFWVSVSVCLCVVWAIGVCAVAGWHGPHA